MKNYLYSKNYLDNILKYTLKNIKSYTILGLLLVAIVIFYQSGFFSFVLSGGTLFYYKNVFIKTIVNLAMLIFGLSPVFLFVYFCYKYMKDRDYINNLIKIHKYFIWGVLVVVLTLLINILSTEIHWRFFGKDAIVKQHEIIFGNKYYWVSQIYIILVWSFSVSLSIYSYYKRIKSNKKWNTIILTPLSYAGIYIIFIIIQYTLVMTLTSSSK